MSEYPPSSRLSVAGPCGRAELLEWEWPSMLDFVRREDAMMVEMSLPPASADASACFPEIDDDRRCFMGTLFVRWPGVQVAGRSEGGLIRVVRCVFEGERARGLLALQPSPSLPFLQALLSIQNETLRGLMRMLQRELSNMRERSEQAVAALLELVAIEVERVIRREAEAGTTARLAPWQFRRIRERLAEGGAAPTVAELATLCGISVRHLHRQFHALTGRTVADYIETTRIEQAKTLLGQREQPIKAIAVACGFARANSFTRAFRRHTGLTPLAFRQAAGSQTYAQSTL